MIYLRSFIFNLLFYLTILLGCIVSVLFGLFVPRRFHWALWNDYLLIFLRKMLRLICGLEIEVRGQEHIQKGAAIYASKHQSAAETYFKTAKKTINIDHHISNADGCGQINYVDPTASSSSELVYELPALPDIQAYCKREVATLWPEVKRFDYPHNYYVDLSDKLLAIKTSLLNARR